MTKLQTKRNTHRKRNLEVIRGAGMTGIVLYHLFPEHFQGGFLGVPLFFVLSGYFMFLTSDISWKKGTFHIGSYYIKRFRKIYPPLFSMIMVICCYMTITKSSHMAGIRQEICSIFLGYDNWWQISQNASYFAKMANASPFTHLWFLAVEIQFYLLWPFLFILYKKGCSIIGSRKMCFFFLLLALVSAGKMFYLYTPGTDPSRVYYGTDTMAFSLLLGIFSGAVMQEYPKAKPHLPFYGNELNTPSILSTFLLILVFLFITVNGQMDFLYQGGMFILSLFFAGIIFILEKYQGDQEMPDVFPLSLLGQKSYSIYLWHYPIIILALL